MGKHHDVATKEQILLAIKNGESVASVSATHGVSTPTIYARLKGQTDNTGTSSLEVATRKPLGSGLQSTVLT